ncbi:hypothetical protein FHX74_000836 [Friedmanniella endophytica]|uniref:Capsular polysaccharide biosynthesis protein n=1 Tax=Microlunatus kandeliicorticis TaxID=1759536 RepID=A0A7W3P4W5_9ACTN|nr:hypothetical protein [Microlunatus kandeliicorticis]MBA8793242.1 hypothetical protein [Microlunatus kandeliicorticis]
MSSQNSFDPWGRSILATIRRWFVFPVALALLGAAAGFGVGSVAAPRGQATLLLQTAATDDSSIARALQSAVIEIGTTPIYVRAGKALGVDPKDLQTRTKVQAVSNAEMLTVTVTASNSTEAARQATAVAQAAVDLNQERTESDLKALTQSTRRLMTDSSSTLPERSAEAARQSALGSGLATSQSTLLSQSDQLSLLEAGSPGTASVGRTTLAGLGLLGGALLGVAIALVIGARRGRVHSTKELHQLYPHLPVLEEAELGAMLALEAGSFSTVIVGGARDGGGHLDALGKTVAAALETSGLQPRLQSQPTSSARHQLAGVTTGAAGEGQPSYPTAEGQQLNGTHRNGRSTEGGLNGHHHGQSGQAWLPSTGRRAQTDAGVGVLVTTLNDAVVRRVNRDPNTLLVVSVEPRSTRLEWLDAYAADLSDRTYLLVHDAAADWAV